MATFTMNMALQAGGTLQASNPLTDANAQRIITAYRTLYEMDPASTAQQVWARIVAGAFNTIKQTTINSEQAAQAAAIVIAPVE